MSGELPKGWVQAKLGDMVTGAHTGFAAGEKEVSHGLRHLRMNNIGLNGELDMGLIRTVHPEMAGHDHLLLPGDVLVCTTNSGKLVGKVALFDLQGDYAFSNHITRLRPKPGIDPGYLRWALWFHWTEGRWQELCRHWANQSSLPREALLDTRLPLPPSSEQRRIVAQIETAFARLAAQRMELEALPTKLKNYRESILSDACSGRMTADWRLRHGESGAELVRQIAGKRIRRLSALEKAETKPTVLKTLADSLEAVTPDVSALPPIPESWCWVSLSFLMNPEESFCYGVVQPGEDDPGGPRMIRVCDIQDGTVDARHLRGIAPDVHEAYSRSVLSGGELLVSVVGTIGRAAIAPSKAAGSNIARAIAKVPVRDVEPQFVLAWLGSRPAQEWMNREVREVARKTLNLAKLRELPVPVPSLAEQREIVRQLKMQFEAAATAEANACRIEETISEMSRQTLAQAFRGELVPQDPEDEPAALLLARIKAITPEPRRRNIRKPGTHRTMKKGSKPPRRPLLDVLQNADGRLTSTELFRQAGYDYDSVDLFYEELKRAVAAGDIKEERPSRSESYLLASSTADKKR